MSHFLSGVVSEGLLLRRCDVAVELDAVLGQVHPGQELCVRRAYGLEVDVDFLARRLVRGLIDLEVGVAQLLLSLPFAPTLLEDHLQNVDLLRSACGGGSDCGCGELGARRVGCCRLCRCFRGRVLGGLCRTVLSASSSSTTQRETG